MKRSRLIRRQQGGHHWQPLVRQTIVPRSPEKIAELLAYAKKVFPDISDAAIMAQLGDADEIWENDRYQVHVRRTDPADVNIPMVHLSIKTLDKSPVRDWRDCQRIKNQLVGPECEAVELYPAESRVVDIANQYHLWAVADPEFRFPLGWFQGRRVAGGSAAGSRQRPLNDEDNTA